MRHTVVISDVHLCEVEPGTGLWMRYRQRAFSPAGEIAAMLGALRERVRGDELELILNGDIFDFDAPRVVGGESVFHDLPRTAAHAVPAMTAILEDHPEFLDSVGRVLADGHCVVFVSGNHDVQLTLPEVRALLSGRIVEAALAAAPGAAREELAARVLFRSWFHHTPDGIHVEHGNQYDVYCCYRYPATPFGREAGEVQPTMGSLATRRLVSRLGYFNPHVDSSFMLSTTGYILHWLRFYLLSRHCLASIWLTGSVSTVIELVRRRDPFDRRRFAESLAAASKETGAPLRAVARQARLFTAPAEDRLGTVMRELWIDRVLVTLLVVAVAALVALIAPGAWRFAGLSAALLFVAYERIVPKPPLDLTWRSVGRASRAVQKIHGARAVVFGHTHQPEGSWEDDRFFGNTGSWSAAFLDIACTKPMFDERPLVWLRSDAEGRISGGLMAWKNKRFVERSFREAAREASPPELAPAEVLAPAPRAANGRIEPIPLEGEVSEIRRRYSVGTERESKTPGIDTTNAIAKNTTNPTRAAR